MPSRTTREEWEALIPFATASQEKYLRACIQHGTQHAAAEALGTTQGLISHSIACARSRAAQRVLGAQLDNELPIKGTTTLLGPDGETKLQWVWRFLTEDQLEEKLREAFAALKEKIPKPSLNIKPLKAQRTDDLLNLHIVTDYHLGMKAWREEAGEDWDLSIAEDLFIKWLTKAIENAPAAETGVLAQLGDFLHWDGLEAVTPTNKHVLDADTRFQKVARVAIRILRRVISLMLLKYEKVHFIVADANHDPASGVWLREMFAAFYDDEKRISVDNSSGTYYCYEHGLTSLFFHHGHKKRVNTVGDVFVSMFREVFGRTKYSYGHLGHLHHKHLLESNLMIVEQHRTMAAKDAYAARSGYLSGRGAEVITYSKRFGEVGRQAYTPEML